MTNRFIALALLIWTSGAWADGPDPFDPRARTYAQHLADIKEYRGLRPLRAEYAALFAARHHEAAWEGCLELARVWRDHADVLVREAYRRHPNRAAIAEAVQGELVRLPELRRWGTAVHLDAVYLGRSIYDNPGFGAERSISVDVGETLGDAALIVHGLDAEGNLVPVDPAFEASGGLEVVTDASGAQSIVAREPSRSARLVVRDRKSGLSCELSLRVIGPVHRIHVRADAAQGKDRFAPGEMLHMRTHLEDAAGNSLWRSRLVWTAQAPGGGESLDRLVARGYSWMHFDVSYEPHVNTLRAGPREPYRGAVAVQVIEPESGARGTISLPLVGDPVPEKAELSGLPFLSDLEAAREASRKEGKPLLLYYHATW